MKKLDNYKKAIEKLRVSIAAHKKDNSEFIRDSVIQRYEFTIELAWKAIKEYLEDQKYRDINSPKKVMKTAYTMDIIENEQTWLEMLDSRNITAHLYNEKLAIAVCNDIITKYITELDKLEQTLTELV